MNQPLRATSVRFALIRTIRILAVLAFTQTFTSCVTATAPIAATSPIVTIAQGKLQGVTEAEGVFAYKGIPFARPPLGERRWAAPEPPDPWGPAVFQATDYAPMCVQVDMKTINYKRTVGDENCLMLNVWTTSLDPKARRPVLVFIHGGGHMSGSSSGSDATGFPLYIGSTLVKGGPSVVVTITYRVGALGFIGHRGLSSRNSYGGSGNYGHLDQIRALEWVRDNISAFGGDPGKVMVFGQSGGASSTLVLLASPLSRGLFHSAVIHSMAAFTFSLADAETKGAVVEKGLGCANEDANKALACMRSKKASEVTLSIPNDLTMGGNGVVFGPNVDGFVLPETMMSLVRSGKQNQIPVIVGSTRDEFVTIAPLMLPSNVTTEEEYRATITKLFSSISQTVSPDAIYRAYPSSAYPSRNEALIEMMSDYVYTCPARMLSATFSRTHKAPVRRFIYTHTFSSPGWGDLRAAHGFELTYLFGPLPQQLALQMNNGERSLSNQMVRGWVDFADGKAPQTFGVDWPVYDPVKDNYLALDTPPRLESGFRQSQCDFWKQYEAELYP